MHGPKDRMKNRLSKFGILGAFAFSALLTLSAAATGTEPIARPAPPLPDSPPPLVAKKGADPAAPQINPIDFKLPSSDDDQLPDVRSAIPRPGCAKSDDPNVITVCGDVPRQSLRLDPKILAATRAAEAPPPGTSAMQAAMNNRGCQTSAMGCTGKATVSFTAIGVTTAMAVIKAIKGEDWKEAFAPPPPTAYDKYREQKAKSEPAAPPVPEPDLTAGSATRAGPEPE